MVKAEAPRSVLGAAGWGRRLRWCSGWWTSSCLASARVPRRRHLRVLPAVLQGHATGPLAARRRDLLRVRRDYPRPRGARAVMPFERRCGGWPLRRGVPVRRVPALLGGRRADHVVQRGEPAAGHARESIPIMLGALTGVICSRSGVMNIAIEGQLLLGAFVAAIVASGSGSLGLGLISGARPVSGGRAARRLRHPATGRPDHPRRGPNTPGPRPHRVPVRRPDGPLPNTLNSPATFSAIKIPLLGDIPIIGPVFFDSRSSST